MGVHDFSLRCLRLPAGVAAITNALLYGTFTATCVHTCASVFPHPLSVPPTAHGRPGVVVIVVVFGADCCLVTSIYYYTRTPPQAELETRLQLGETAEQRRLRERNRVEEADNDLTEDLFGGGGDGGGGKGGAGGGLSGLALKNMQVCDGVPFNVVKLVLECGEKIVSRRGCPVAECI